MTFETKRDTSMLSELGKAAVWYCENGFGIIPLYPRTKTPAMKLGLNDWFSDPKDAFELWTEIPDLNIAIVCGNASDNLTVFDFDEDDEKDTHGFDTLAEWEDENGELTPTATAITGRGGMHYLYRDSRSYSPSVNRDIGVDVRSEGSYIVAPPSIHPNGGRYEWNAGDEPWNRPIAQMTDNERALLDHVQRNGGVSQDSPIQDTRFKLPKRIKSGERNDTLYRYGCSLRTRGYADDAIDAMLRQANESNCVKPMDEREISSIIRQVCKRGPGYDGQGTFIGEDGGGGVHAPGKTEGAVGAEDEIPTFRTGNRNVIQHNLLARVLMERNKARTIDGALAIWTGNRWGFGVRAVKSVCTMYADDIKEAQRTEVLKYLTSSLELPKVASDNGFDGRYYVQFANGTWDVLTESFVEPNPDMYIIGALPIPLDLNAQYGLADEFIASIANGDTQVERVMKEIIGACMCSSLVVDQAPMLIGRANGITASNGKSTFINMLRSLLGPDNVSTLDVTMYGKPFFVANLIGKLANLGDDIPASYLQGQEASMWKRAITGDEISADVKYGDSFDFRPTATQIFSMNVVPRISADDDGLYRRLAFVPFRNHFAPDVEGFDPHLKTKLAREDTLQRFAILGLLELRSIIDRSKFSEIDDMRQELNDIRTNNDVVRRWIEWAGIEPDTIVGQWVNNVYADFKKFVEEANETKLSQSKFTRRLLATWPQIETMNTRDRGADKRGRKFVFKTDRLNFD